MIHLINLELFYYLLSFLIFGIFGFLCAYFKEIYLQFRKEQNILEPTKKILFFQELPIEIQKKILMDAFYISGKWFLISIVTAFVTFISEFLATGELGTYFTIEGLWIVAAIVILPIFGINGVKWISIYIIPFILKFFDQKAVKARKIAKLEKLVAANELERNKLEPEVKRLEQTQKSS